MYGYKETGGFREGDFCRRHTTGIRGSSGVLYFVWIPRYSGVVVFCFIYLCFGIALSTRDYRTIVTIVIVPAPGVGTIIVSVKE